MDYKKLIPSLFTQLTNHWGMSTTYGQGTEVDWKIHVTNKVSHFHPRRNIAIGYKEYAPSVMVPCVARKVYELGFWASMPFRPNHDDRPDYKILVQDHNKDGFRIFKNRYGIAENILWPGEVYLDKIEIILKHILDEGQMKKPN